MCRANYIVVIIHRLAHAHVNDVVYPAVMFLRAVELVDYFAGGEISLEFDSAGCAEATAHTATGLAGNTKGFSVPVKQKYRFDAQTVGQLEKKLYRCVGVGQFVERFKAGNIETVFHELPAESFRQGGNIVNSFGVLSVDKGEDVFGEIVFLAQVSDKPGKLTESFIFKVLIHGAYYSRIAKAKTG